MVPFIPVNYSKIINVPEQSVFVDGEENSVKMMAEVLQTKGVDAGMELLVREICRLNIDSQRKATKLDRRYMSEVLRQVEAREKTYLVRQKKYLITSHPDNPDCRCEKCLMRSRRKKKCTATAMYMENKSTF